MCLSSSAFLLILGFSDDFLGQVAPTPPRSLAVEGHVWFCGAA